MRRVDLFPLRFFRFLIARLVEYLRPTGPRDRLLRRCRRENEVDPSRQQRFDLYRNEKASMRKGRP